MKIKLLLSLLLISIITTACNSNNPTTKHYSSVDEYEKDMINVQATYPAFKFTTNKNVNEKLFKIVCYIKGNKIRDDMIISPHTNQLAITTYNGKKTFLIDKIATVTISKKEIPVWPKELFVSHTLTKWNAPETLQGVESKKFTNTNANFNGIPCRMIEYIYKNGNTAEVCVNDKYGVAIYHNFKGYRTLNGRVEKKPYQGTIEVTKIESNNLDDSIFSP